MKSRLLVATGLLALTTLAGSPLAAHAKNSKPARADLRAALVGSAAFPDAKGKARFRDEGKKNRDVKSEVEDVNLPAGTMVKLFLDGTQVGKAVALQDEAQNEDAHGRRGSDDSGTTRSANAGSAEIEVTNRHNSHISQVKSGSLVQWETTDGTVIASGMFK